MTDQLLSLVGHLGGAALVGAAAVMLIKKYAVPAYRKRIAAVLGQAMHLSTSDPQLDGLLRAHVLSGVRLAEYLIPDRGMGSAKFALVDGALAKCGLPPAVRKVLIEEAVYSLDDSLKAAIAKEVTPEVLPKP